MTRPDIRIYTAALPHPSAGAVNARYEITVRGGHPRKYIPEEVKAWDESTYWALREQSWFPLPRWQGLWFLQIRYILSTVRQDVDAPGKALQDVIARALDVDDRYVGHVEAFKFRVRSYKDESLTVSLIAVPVADENEHRDLAMTLAQFDEAGQHLRIAFPRL